MDHTLTIDHTILLSTYKVFIKVIVPHTNNSKFLLIESSQKVICKGNSEILLLTIKIGVG